MRNIFAIFSITSLIFSATINIPSDYATIQSGINAAQEGDTVLVAEGLYSENLILDKEIVLASHAIYDDLTDNWLSNGFIQETVVDGNFSGSCLVIRDGNIQPTILGFTFRSGNGTSMNFSSCDIVNDERSGGAILIFKAYPTINYNRFLDNGMPPTGGLIAAPAVANGGAISHFADDDVEFDEDRGHLCGDGGPCPFRPNQNNNSSRDVPEEMNIQFNYFEDNGSGNGENFYSQGFEGSIDVSGSVFENMDCETGSVNDFILHSTDNDANYIQNDIQGTCIEDNIYYVDPISGDDNNIGSESAPFKTIGHALTLVKPDGDITTVQLEAGTYSRGTNGEVFPVVLPDKVYLIGDGRESTILDADADQSNEAGVMIIKEVTDVYVSDMTLANGYSEGHGCYGGGALLVTANDMHDLDAPMMQNDAVIENVIIENSHSHNGGGISFFRVDGPVLTNVIVRDNTATFQGGGICVYVSDITMTDIEINNNSCFGTTWEGINDMGHGGGLFLHHSSGTFDQLNIHNNTASSNGGGVWSSDASNWTMSNSIIDNNIAPWLGGGFGFWNHDGFAEDTNPTLQNVTISNNLANPSQTGWGIGHGGGVWASNSSTIFENCTIINNHANGNGGGVDYFDGGFPIFKNTIFDGNSSTEFGGAIYIHEDADGFYIERCLFTNNTSTYNGAAVSAGKSGTIANSTFFGNVTNEDGAVNIYNATTYVNILNSILWNNNMQYQIAGYAGNTNLRYSNVQNGEMYGGENNIYLDPLFTDSENDDFTLLSTSPCIDAGIADFNGDGVDDVDEYFGPAPDMGAYEFLVAADGLQIYVSNTSVILVWNPFDEAAYYQLERSTDSLFTTDVTSSYVSVNTFTDTDLEYDTYYYYRVAAFIGTGFSGYLTGWSNTVSVILESASLSDGGSVPASFAIHQNLFPL